MTATNSIIILSAVTPTLFSITIILVLQLLREKVSIIVAGICSGLAVLITLTYLLTPLIPLPYATYVVLTILLAATVALWIVYPVRQMWRASTLDRTALVAIIGLCTLSALIAPKLLVEKNEELYTGVINAWGDLGFHVSAITLLAENNTLSPENPIFAGHKLVYPFLSDFLSGMLLAGGAHVTTAVVAPALILIPTALLLLYSLSRNITASKTAAVIALLLFTFGGSTMGWLYFPDDWQASGQPLREFMQHLPRNYTGHSNNANGLYLVNPLISMLLPQRGFLFGMPLALCILLLLTQSHAPKKPAYITAGILAGMLPLFHAHTVVALTAAIAVLIVTQPKREWFLFVAAAAVIGLPEVLYYINSESAASTLPRIQLGWMAHEENILIFWLKNSGLLIGLTLIGLFVKTKRPLKALAIAGLVLFVAANIWRFAAWEWDNTKLLIYWFIFTIPLIAHTLSKILNSKNIIGAGAAAALLLAHTLAGILDVYQLTPPDAPLWMEWDQASIAMASAIKKLTEPGEDILTAPIHNSTVALAGRAVYLGFPGHVWTHGGNHWQREAAIQPFYQGEIATLPEIMPRYVLVGPIERDHFPALTVRPEWELLARHKNYRLYALPQ